MEAAKWNNGPHILEFEPPDIMHVYINAPVVPDEARESLRIINQEVAPKVSEFYLLLHIASGAGALSTDVRKAVADTKPNWQAAAMVGGTALSRAVLNVTLRALSLLSGKQPPTKMVSTLEEAYAFINGMRGAKVDKAANG